MGAGVVDFYVGFAIYGDYFDLYFLLGRIVNDIY